MLRGKIDTSVRRLPTIEDVTFSVKSGTMTVKHGAAADLKAIEKQVSGLGYSVAPIIPTAKLSAVNPGGMATLVTVMDRHPPPARWKAFTVMTTGRTKGSGGAARRGS